MSEHVLYELDEPTGVVTITLDRPEKRNALDPETITALEAAFAAAEEDGGARVILLAGNGKDFCAGADIAHIEAMVDASRDELLEDARRMGRLFVRMRALPKPIVAAVHGNALAGGAGLATACDIVLAADDAHFGYPEVHIGFVPAMVLTMLTRSVGEKRAFELVTSGRRFAAEEALRLGLIHCLYSRHTFADDVRAYAVELAGRSATSMALSKRLLYELDGLTFEEGIERGAQVNAEARRTDDCRAGVRAFLSREKKRES
ncbi:MAG: enoyl-CoA hydratase/isomerase family protein [Gemmatimonadetes bacterium]|nr:enoyl-CoA hydratase/isomerase family protein [Gemmatimonadota bacterium]